MVLSNKQFVENDGCFLVFADGSSVDIATQVVTNKGPGEIIIKDLPMWPPMADILREEMVLKHIDRLSISGDMNNIIILPNGTGEGEDNSCFVSIGGAEEFIQNCSVYQKSSQLFISTPKSNSNVHVHMGSVWINGKRQPPKFEDDFGYIQIKCNSLYSLFIEDSGSGEMYSQVPIDLLRGSIRGSTSIDAIALENVELHISGSGSLVADQLNGYLHGRISGSGNINVLSGLIESADVQISGSGSLFVAGAIKTADLSHSGSGKMVIAQVLNGYTARKSGSGFIKVLKVGP